ncbi:hypothetical protein IWW36_002421 [Coemansia brasiliensis]|uniref:PDZ domain-containing protein n=1 Tax=Coemansia brasiliensis TaxID=2650707 RepID=A0A9W8I9N5_9FUNG|nr:hypothetical protein IWW36_002421 [Coemansia brasiliensis]
MTIDFNKAGDITESYSWSTLQDRLRDSIVSTNSSVAVSFDTTSSTLTNATGFVVDAENGIILSNRHVMSAGPSSHKATFFNNQEVPLQPFYYDPEHDFAFFRYDPAELKGIKPRAIKLVPEKARSGLEIRVIGNNSREKMSVHQGELSQLDRNVPEYRDSAYESYNDMNTFYYQSSTSSKEGSSGSPVVDVAGDAVAINSGGNFYSSSSFFLPLQRVKYAFEFVRQGKIPPRGTLQTVFHHQSHVKAELLGLTTELAASEGIDKENSTGVLTVKKVVPKGPADGVLKVGDIVVSVNGTVVTGFPELFEIIDGAVGQNVSLRVFRNHEFTTVNATVQDIYQVTPTRALRLGNSILHELSFQEAAARGSTAVTGIKINNDYNGMFSSADLGRRRVITEINYKPIPNMDALIQLLQIVHYDEPLVVKVRDFKEPRDEAVIVAHFPQVARPNALFTRSLETGFWSIEPLKLPLTHSPKLDAVEAEFSINEDNPENSAILSTASDIAARIQQCSVWIEARPICPANGYNAAHARGTGLVVDPQRGLILCSSRLAKNPTSNISVTFGAMRISASLAYIHPLYPFAFVKYDPALVDCTIPKLELSRPSSRLDVGDSVNIVTGTQSGLVCSTAAVSERCMLSTYACKWCLEQRFFNIEQFSLSPLPAQVGSDIGLVCSNDAIQGLWLCLPTCLHCNTICKNVGIDISLIRPSLVQLQTSDNIPAAPRVLDVEFKHQSLAEARALGVSSSYIKYLQKLSTAAQPILSVNRILRVRSPEIPSLEVGDIILQVNNCHVKHMDEVACFDTSEVELLIIRKGQEMTITIPTAPLCDANIRKVICWAGMYLQEPFHTVLHQSVRLASNVYMFMFDSGTPAMAESYHDNMFVVEIGENAIYTLDEVAQVAKLLKDPKQTGFNADIAENKGFRSGTVPGRDVKIRVVLVNGDEVVKSIRTNDHYYPAWQLVRGPRIDDKWVYKAI